jgi:hypothetical protein
MTVRTLSLLPILVLSAVGGAFLQAQNQSGMVPFTMDNRAGARSHSPVDVSYLLDAPAGKHGFVIVKDGHLATEDGQRIRLWGVNITDWSRGSRQIPSKEDAPMIADTLARFGVNSVRFQFLDFAVPRGLIAKGDGTRVLDNEYLDLEDYFIAQLEKRGIYIDFNLLVGRPFQAADGVQDAAMLHQGAKGTSLFDKRLIELQKEYAQQLLDHLNPYTHKKYTVDPAVAIVEINNENAINVGYRAPSKFYEDELTAMYNQWLSQHRDTEQIAKLREIAHVSASEPMPLIGGRGRNQTPPERFRTEASFFEDLQRGYFEDMEKYIKQGLGARSLIIATADHSHSGSGYPILLAMSTMDIIDGHTYWQHPEYYVKKLPMVNDPFNSTVVELSRSAMKGKPYTASEVNEPFPNDYGGEGIPILAAYGALQDWDAIMWYTFEPKPDPAWKPYIGDAFDISFDPVKMPELAAGAMLFLRGDVEKARSISERSYSETQVVDSMLLPSTERPYFTEGFPLYLPLEHEVRISSLTGAPTQKFDDTPTPSPIVSDTRQLHWYTTPKQNGLVTVDTPRSQALIGFVKEQGKADSILSADVSNVFCTILLSSMDTQAIATSSKLLLVAGGPVQNSGQEWNTAGTDVTSFGGTPTMIDQVKGTITLHGLHNARTVTLQPIDGAGQPLGQPISAKGHGADWTLPLGTPVTTWYQITVTH